MNSGCRAESRWKISECELIEVSKLLFAYDETATRRIRALIETAQQARKRDA